MHIEYPVSPEDVVSEVRGRIDYTEPWCCGCKMLPQFTFRDASGNLHRAFICHICKRKKSIKVANGRKNDEPKRSE